jgi:hypothetical protein
MSGMHQKASGSPRGRGPTVHEIRTRKGIAIVTVLVTISVVGLLMASFWTSVDLDARAARSRQDAIRARHLAESGFAHGMGILQQQIPTVSVDGLLRGADGVAGNADDGLLISHPGLGSAVQIPADGRSFGGGQYFVTLLDDPNDTQAGGTVDDGQGRFVLSCRAVLPSGATAEVRALLQRPTTSTAGPALHMGNNIEITGRMSIEGTCGRGHVNGQFTGAGQPTAQVEWSSTGNPIPAGYIGTKNPGIDAIPVDFATNVLSYCTGPNVEYITGSPWRPRERDLQQFRTYCVTGNVEFDAEFGNTNIHRRYSVIATGSIRLARNLFFEAWHPDGIVLLAGGDLDIQANAGLIGRVMCGSQLNITGSPVIQGTVSCADRSNPAGSQDLVTANRISGNPRIVYPCPAGAGVASGVTEFLSWYPVIGT